MAAGRAVFPHEIKIVSLNSQEFLSDPQLLGGGHSFAVRGTLKKLPRGYEIWVMTQDDVTGAHGRKARRRLAFRRPVISSIQARSKRRVQTSERMSIDY